VWKLTVSNFRKKNYSWAIWIESNWSKTIYGKKNLKILFNWYALALEYKRNWSQINRRAAISKLFNHVKSYLPITFPRSSFFFAEKMDNYESTRNLLVAGIEQCEADDNQKHFKKELKENCLLKFLLENDLMIERIFRRNSFLFFSQSLLNLTFLRHFIFNPWLPNKTFAI